MKNTILKLLLLLVLVFSLTLSIAACDSEDDGSDKNDNTSNQSGNEEHTHYFSDWITAKPATCADQGELARVCLTCTARESKVLETIDHVYVNGVCTGCGHSLYPAGIVDIGKMDSFEYSKVPAFSGAEYVVVNGNVPFFTDDEIVTDSYETYGALDNLQRCTTVMACIGKDIMPTESRGDISHKPTGWVQAQYSFIGADSLYNRCHLIAWQLTAENNNKQNLVTGTRFMNEAMIPFEDMVAKYIKETDNHVMYRATPIFVGDNLLCQGVLVEAYSVEDEGDGICFNVFLYNVQPGVVLDYATGQSRAENEEANKPSVAPEDCDYVLNKSNKKIHTPTCHNVNSMKESNKEYYTGDIQDLLDDGYVAAGCCNPK